jgi:hypothetical protein
MEDAEVFHGLDQSSTIATSDYEAVYILFVILTCMIGIILAISLGCDIISDHKRWHCGDNNDNSVHDAGVKKGRSSWAVKAAQVTLFLLLGGGVSLVVWGSDVRANSVLHNDHDRVAKGLAIFGADGVIFSFPCLAYGLRGDIRMNVIMAASFFLIIPGWILLAVSFRLLSLLSQSESYEFMTMLITKSRLKFDNSIECDYDGNTCIGYRGQLEVSWGSEFLSCPNAPPGLWYSDWITDPSCDRYTHNVSNTFVKDEVTSTSESVAECIKERYDLMAFGEEIESDQALGWPRAGVESFIQG